MAYRNRWPSERSLRRTLRDEVYIMTAQTRDAIVATVPCPNRTCGAKVGAPCRGQNLPHRARAAAYRKGGA
jgi:hypothetical protein